ncbi:AraC family transcriptional regulator [Spirosoma fluviale]|uniref:Transcriptional regulator, AraC family n=1 Tax=Spirosoma fluviale TaxID=1597977 RepID=A0A286F502_9BACT|nr:AraC family transcriptional regulator [Spirosoma fluviale]SOD78196.1 transcriptional regulator, AraC family [Spirosoma fluviale]
MCTNLSSQHLLNLLDYAVCKGLDRRLLLSQLDVPESDLTDEKGWVSLADYTRLWAGMLDLSRDPHLGLHYGYYLNLRALGLVYQISLASSSIEQALGLLADYLASTFPVINLVTTQHQDHLIIELQSSLLQNPLKNQVLDSVLFLMYREISLMIEDDIAEVQVPYSQLEEYQRLCASPITTANAHRLMVELRLVAGPINRRRLKNLDVLLPVFLQLLGQSPVRRSPFADQVRTMILNLCSPELPCLDEVVSQFAMSHRTFQRKLTEEGTSFRSIADDIKRQMATHLERGRTLGTQDIAYLLGYSASSAYLHAARKWRQQPAG